MRNTLNFESRKPIEYLSTRTFFFTAIVLVSMRFYSSLWNVDTYHEGDKYPSIIVMAQGGMIFKDVNHIYGFLMTFINFPFVKIFGNYLLVTRITGFITQILLIWISYLLFRMFVNLQTSRLIALLLLSIANAWSWINPNIGASGNTWPTHYGMFFTCASLLLLLNRSNRSNWNLLRFGAAGFLSATAWSARLEFIAVWLLQTLAIVLITLLYKNIKGRELASWVIGSTSYFTITLSFLHFNGAFNDWFIQTIKVWFSNPPAQPAFNLAWLLVNGVSFFAVATLPLGIFLITHVGTQKKWGMAMQFLAYTLLIIGWISFGQIFKTLEIGKYPINEWIGAIIRRGLFGFAPVFVFIFIASLVLVIKKKSRTAISNLGDLEKSNLLILVSTCLGVFSLFHIVNADYLVMSITPFICFSLFYLKHFSVKFSRDHFLKSFNATLSVIIILSAALFIQKNVSSEIYHYKTPILKGMIDHNVERGIDTDNNFQEIQTAVGSGKIWTFCILGLYSVNNEGFISNDKWVWNLQPEKWMAPRILQPKLGDVLLVCNLSSSEQTIFDQRVTKGEFTLLKQIHGMNLYKVIK